MRLIFFSPRRSLSNTSKRRFTFFRKIEPETLEISKAAEIFQTTVQVFKKKAKQRRHTRNVFSPGRIAPKTSRGIKSLKFTSLEFKDSLYFFFFFLIVPALLSWEDVELLAELSKCPPPVRPAICQHSHLNKYRSISGLCNNR